MSTLSVGGLVSGLDTNSIISQLTALEQAKVTREAKKKEAAESTLEKFNDLETRLGNLQQKANELASASNFNVFKSLSNYDDYATASGGEGATAGKYELVVHQLASTQKIASKSFEKTNEALNASGTLTISTSAATQSADSTKKTVDIEIKESDTLKDIVNKINAAEGAGVKASLMTLSNGETRLVLTAVDTGTQSFYMSDGGGSILGDALGLVNYDTQSGASSGAFLTQNGMVNEDNMDSVLLTDLNTTLNKNNFTNGDVLGIKIGNDWITTSLFDENGNSRTVGDALKDINDALDSVYGGAIKASLNSSGEIVFTSDDTVDPNDFRTFLSSVEVKMGTFSGNDFTTVKKNMGSFSEVNVFENEINAGSNAFYTLDGMAISSRSNNDDKTINGTTFNLKKADPSIVINISLELDSDALVNKITELIEEFNSLLKFIDENTKATIKDETDSTTGKTVSTRVTGAFTGDSNISGLRENLRKMLTGIIDELTGTGSHSDSGYSTNYSSASRIGITTDKDGYLSVDKDKLSSALSADFEGVRRLFTASGFSNDTGYSVGNYLKGTKAGVIEISNGGSTIKLNGVELEYGTDYSIRGNILTTKDGLSIEMPDDYESRSGTAKITFVRGVASQLSTFVENAKNSVDGYFKKSKENYQNRIDEIQKRIDQLQIRVDNYTTRLTNQFAALERSLSNLQNQTSSILSALG